MAKKRKATQPKETTERTQPSEVRKTITQQKLRSLLASAKAAQSNINEISGGLGSEIKEAVEKHHLHRKAFNVCKQANRMEPEKLAEFLDYLDHYLDISGLRDRAAKVQRLDMGEGEVEEDDDDKVHQFPRPTGAAAE